MKFQCQHVLLLLSVSADVLGVHRHRQLAESEEAQDGYGAGQRKGAEQTEARSSSSNTGSSSKQLDATERKRGKIMSNIDCADAHCSKGEAKSAATSGAHAATDVSATHTSMSEAKIAKATAETNRTAKTNRTITSETRKTRAAVRHVERAAKEAVRKSMTANLTDGANLTDEYELLIRKQARKAGRKARHALEDKIANSGSIAEAVTTAESVLRGEAPATPLPGERTSDGAADATSFEDDTSKEASAGNTSSEENSASDEEPADDAVIEATADGEVVASAEVVHEAATDVAVAGKAPHKGSRKADGKAASGNTQAGAEAAPEASPSDAVIDVAAVGSENESGAAATDAAVAGTAPAEQAASDKAAEQAARKAAAASRREARRARKAAAKEDAKKVSKDPRDGTDGHGAMITASLDNTTKLVSSQDRAELARLQEARQDTDPVAHAHVVMKDDPPPVPRVVVQDVKVLDKPEAPSDPTPAPDQVTAAEPSMKFTTNVGDLPAFILTLVVSSVLVISSFIAFGYLRPAFPLVYAGNVVLSKAPLQPSDSFFGWVSASLKLSPETIVESAGLDQAQLIDFTLVGMRVLFTTGVPLICVLGPLHWVYGGKAAGEDHLSWLSMANVRDNHPWLYWVHAAVVWLVVVRVQRAVYAAQRKFLVRRTAWLKDIPYPRNMTVLCEDIPEKYRSDERLRQYFDRLFGKPVVEKCYVIKNTETLLGLKTSLAATNDCMQQAKQCFQSTGARPTTWTATGSRDAMEYYQEQSAAIQKEIDHEIASIKTRAVTDEGHNVQCSSAFITFKTRRDAEMAEKITYTSNKEEFVVSRAPEPADVIYTDFMQDPLTESSKQAFGWACIAGVFVMYVPVVVFSAKVTNLERLAKLVPWMQYFLDDPPFINAWNGLVGAMMVAVSMSFVPVIYCFINDQFFLLKTRSNLQASIQSFFFWFLVLYVLFVFCLGSDVVDTLEELGRHPLRIFKLLATTMPPASHFYLSVTLLTWVSNSFHLLRLVQLSKFCYLRQTYGEETAKLKSEPEGQDCNGIGARSATLSFSLVMALVYCTISPLITALGFLNFLLCRVVYGYLTTFAETRKPDLGGRFWVSQLKHLQQGMFIYVALMGGMLLARNDDPRPAFFAFGAFAFLVFSNLRFNRAFHWETLCLEDMTSGGMSNNKTAENMNAYLQEELQSSMDATHLEQELGGHLGSKLARLMGGDESPKQRAIYMGNMSSDGRTNRPGPVTKTTQAPFSRSWLQRFSMKSNTGSGGSAGR